MRSIKLFIASSLDGYIARKNEDVEWLFTDQDYGYTEFYDQVDTVIMGRKTYDVSMRLSEGEYPYQDKESFVFSKSLEGQDNENVTFIGSDLESFVTSLRQSDGRDIWLVGGSDLACWFIQQGFLDELILSVHPIILGDGIPLITRDATLETPLELQDVKTYGTGLIQLFYRL
ncbi:riboflavin biosynthesis protein RibD [Leptolyngbya sp. 'hensonii']|uniref:dihydrofolate reductase family protein n=1 Tax=Leptolyngbya sp. 'hensonii' TaxID=1922337 RepID=UPI00094F9C46|nr:dihydrofolate reductase family protein [Leptolyngbya sp. 'hensonii']OLP15422.1 riboflavin biosynthesis protein RibD [Leptolyngbya sp. 'hensonii']